jgi:hypothetical protein
VRCGTDRWIALLGAGCRYVGLDIYSSRVSPKDKPLVWLHGEVKSPPLSAAARLKQASCSDSFSRVRINDAAVTWRIVGCRRRLKEYDDA